MRNAIPLIEDADRIKIVSHPLHAEKGRAYLARRRPELAAKLVPAKDYRFGEWIPKRRLTVFTGVSGSGKSSLVFDTIAAESQRLINETYSAFVQGLMPTLARPEVDVLEGLTTAIIVDQQRMGADPHSTVGTATDANAMLRILFSRLGQPHIGSPQAFSFNGGFHRLVAGRLDAAGQARLLELLVVDPLSRQSALPRLTRPAPRATVSRLREHIAWLAWSDALGPTEDWLAGVPPAKVSHFAGEAAVLDADELSGVSEDKRLTLLACLVHTARIRARDEVVTMFCKRMAIITKKAREKLEELREQHRTESERLLGVFGDVLAGVREALGPTEAEQGGDENDKPDGDGSRPAWWGRSRSGWWPSVPGGCC